MFNHQHYVPVLKWKMGEYQALHRLNATVKTQLTPVLEVMPAGFDFETGQQRKTADEHLADFGKRLKAKWPARCFIDLKYIKPETRMDGNRHCVEHIFGSARTEGCVTIPVVSLASDSAFLSAVADVVTADRRGVCLRLVALDFDKGNFAEEIERVLRTVGVNWGDADLIIDLGTPTYVPFAAYTRTLRALSTMIPMLNRWRTFTVLGTSYPQTLQGMASNVHLFPRNEWDGYKAHLLLGDDARIPTFGDYAAAHPDPVELDMRMIKPFAKLRYTVTNADGAFWYIARGSAVRTNGFGQYRDMCEQLRSEPYFDGGDFSVADVYITDCAAGIVPTGNLSTWVWVATNRHLTKVVSDLATLHEL